MKKTFIRCAVGVGVILILYTCLMIRTPVKADPAIWKEYHSSRVTGH